MSEISASTDDTPDQIARIRAAPSPSLVTGLPPQTGGLPLTAFDDGYAAISGSPQIAGLSFSPPGTPLSPYSPAAQGVTSAEPGPDPRSPAGQGWTPPQAGSGPTTAPNIPPSGAGSAGAATSDGLLLTPNLATTGRWPVDWSDESLPFKERYDDMLRHMPANLRPGVQVEDAYRTEEQQRQLYDDPTAGGPGHVVARPGPNAPHVKGIAADLKFVGPMGPAAEQWVRANAHDYELGFPLANDPNHMQLAENIDKTKYDVPLLQRTMYRLESDDGRDPKTKVAFDPNNPDAPVGPAQIKMETFREFARPGEDINNPQQNLDVGYRALAEYYKRYGGDMDKALIAYNAGPDKVNLPRNQLSPETQAYLDKAHKLWNDGAAIAVLNGTRVPSGGSDAQARADALAQQRIDTLRTRLDALTKQINAADPTSTAVLDLLRQNQEHANQLQRALEERIFKPPQPQDYQTNMFGKFGSLATVIGIFGGLLARAPLTASLGAGAAAMEAINQGDYDRYKDQFHLWDTQVNAIGKALELQHSTYREILTTAEWTDREKWERIHEAASLFNDQATLLDIEQGNAQAIADRPMKQQKLQADLENTQAETRKRNAEAAKAWAISAREQEYGGELGKDDEVNTVARPLFDVKYADYVKTAPAGTRPLTKAEFATTPEGRQAAADAVVQAKHQLGTEKEGGLEQQILNQKDKERQAAGQPKMTADERAAELASIRASDRPPSASQLADEKQASEVWTVLNLGDQTIGMIESAQMTVGLSGRLVGRPAEIVGNILGASDETTRAQIQSNISNLRLQMVPLLTGIHRTTGRELDLSTAIVRGLEPGSTVQNTVRSIEEAQDAIRSQYYPQLVRHGFLSPDPNRPTVLGAPAANPAQPAPLSPRSSTVESLPDPKTVAEHTRSRNMETGEIQEVIGGKWVTVH